MHAQPLRRLAMEPLSDSAWRLCDQSVAPSNAESLIAYVEQREDALYEVTWVAHGFATATFKTMGELLNSASALLAKAPMDVDTNVRPLRPRRRPCRTLTATPAPQAS